MTILVKKVFFPTHTKEAYEVFSHIFMFQGCLFGASRFSSPTDLDFCLFCRSAPTAHNRVGCGVKAPFRRRCSVLLAGLGTFWSLIFFSWQNQTWRQSQCVVSTKNCRFFVNVNPNFWGGTCVCEIEVGSSWRENFQVSHAAVVGLNNGIGDLIRNEKQISHACVPHPHFHMKYPEHDKRNLVSSFCFNTQMPNCSVVWILLRAKQNCCGMSWSFEITKCFVVPAAIDSSVAFHPFHGKVAQNWNRCHKSEETWETFVSWKRQRATKVRAM